MRNRNSSFGRGTGVFTCDICTRRTRETGDGVDHLCHECFEISGLDNQVNDNDTGPGTPEHASVLKECEALLAEAVAKGSNGAKIKAAADFVFGTASWNARGARRAARQEVRDLVAALNLPPPQPASCRAMNPHPTQEPDMTAIATQARASARQTQSHLLSEWHDAQRPALNRYVAATLAALSAMDDLRASFMFACEIERHDRYACDTAAAARDFIGDTIGAIAKRLDYEGGDPGDIAIDSSELCELHALLKLRADSYQPQPWPREPGSK